MPLTPETWLDEFIVNLTTTGTQSDPDIVQLANGTILVVWTSFDNSGVGSPPGSDIIGQIFDPLGVRIGGEFLVNSSSSGQNEGHAEIAALPSGGFLSVFERPNGSFRDLWLQEHDATGAVTHSSFVFFDGNSTGAPDGFDPRVAVNSAGIALVIWRETEVGGDSKIVGKTYDAATNTLGAEISLINLPGGNFTPDVAALSNGNFVIVARHLDGTDNEISIRIITSAGANVLSVTKIAATDGDGHSDIDPSVTALTGGGYVVAWSNTDTNDSDIELQVFNNAGGTVSGLITLPLGAADDNANEPVVVSLTDGGFAVIFDEDTDNNLRVQRYSSTGATIGNEFVISTGAAITQPSATLLADGRFAVTFVTATGEIGMEILDTRDNANAVGVYAPDQYQIGTIGNDVFTADAFSAFVYGHDGNDTITEAGIDKHYFGGNGNDILIVRSAINGDLHDGGPGIDLIDWSLSREAGATFNLGTGLAVDSALNNEVMTGFEHLVGTFNRDIIFGSAAANYLSGSRGNDEIYGGDGDDYLRGSNGHDWVIGDAGADKLFGGSGGDHLWGRSQNDLLYGGKGNDKMWGGAGHDRMYGEGGDERMWGGSGSDHIFGGGGRDRLYGGNAYGVPKDGNDALYGGPGEDLLYGGTGDDRLVGGGGDDLLYGGSGNDKFIFREGWGRDVIKDFAVASTAEVIDLSAVAEITSFADLVDNHLSTNASGFAVITAGVNRITIEGVSAASLTAGDFIF